MRKILDLIRLNIKRDFLINIAMAFLLPFAYIVLPIFIGSGTMSTESFDYGVVNLDQGEFGQEVIDSFHMENQFKLLDQDLASQQLNDEEIQVYFVLPEDFSSKVEDGKYPKVQVKALDAEAWEGIAPDFTLHLKQTIRENILDQKLFDLGLENIEFKQYWQVDVVTTDAKYDEAKSLMLMICYSIFFTGSIYSAYLVKDKNDGIFYRGVSTPTKPHTLLAGSLLANLLVQFVGMVLVIAIYYFFVSFSLTPAVIFRIIVITFVVCLFVLAVQVLTMRIFKQEGVAVAINMLMAMLFTFFGLFYSMKAVLTQVPDFVFNVRYLSPFYWAESAIDGSLVLNLIPLLVAGGLIFYFASRKPEKFLFN